MARIARAQFSPVKWAGLKVMADWAFAEDKDFVGVSHNGGWIDLSQLPTPQKEKFSAACTAGAPEGTFI